MNVSNLAFYIGKSSNRNVTIYSYNIADNDNNIIDMFNPLEYYWIMREKESAPREELTVVEKNIVYSYDVLDTDTDTIAIKIKALPNDIIRIKKINNKYCTVISLTDPVTNIEKDVHLKKVFCHVSGALGTFVDSIDIIYEDPDTKKVTHLFTKRRQRSRPFNKKINLLHMHPSHPSRRPHPSHPSRRPLPVMHMGLLHLG